MKKLLLSLLAASALLASAAEWRIASNGKDTVILTDQPCTLEIAKKMMPAEMFSRAKRADAVVDKVHFNACYVVEGGIVGILYEDGDAGMIPVEAFHLLKTT